MRIQRRITAAFVGAAVTVGGGGALGAVAVEPEPTEIVISGKTFGPEDGLFHESGSVDVSPSTGIGTQAVTTYWRGTSYASTDHYTDITYYGAARARANIYNGNRVVTAKFKYTRVGDVISWQTSSASVNSSCAWSAGPEKSRTVYDSLDPDAPTTKFRYDFAFVSRSAC